MTSLVDQISPLAKDGSAGHETRESAGSFSIDPGTAPVAEVRAAADAILQLSERDQEHQLVTDVLDKLAAGGLAAAGLPDCLWAGSVAAVQTLLVAEGATVPGVVCDQSGWLALSGETCPLSGGPSRHVPDVIDELAAAVRLDVRQWLICTAVALSIVVAAEIRKAVLRRTAAKAIHPSSAPGRGH